MRSLPSHSLEYLQERWGTWYDDAVVDVCCSDPTSQMENSITMCYGYLQDVVKGEDDTGGKKALRKSDTFKKLIKTFEEQAARGFSMHPKMDVLKTLLVDHFAKQLPDDAEGSNVSSRQSRAMVFVSFRECVEEIVELLNKESPIIRAKPFIGQGTDKQGKKGYGQKQQLEVSNACDFVPCYGLKT